MRNAVFPIAVGLLASASLAQSPSSAPSGAASTELTITLSSFDFSPSTIRLRAGQPVTLRLVNDGRGAHNFSAPQFFGAATIRPADQGLIYKGAVEVPGRRSKSIHLVPRAGRYQLRCTHTLHTALGMKGEIVVE